MAAELQAGDDAARLFSTAGGVTELVDRPLFSLGRGVTMLEALLPRSHNPLQSRIARNADHVMDIVAFAPADHTLPTETRGGANDDAHRWSHLPQAAHQQLDDSGCMLDAVDPAVAQHAREQTLAGEHVQRQVAVVIVVGVELGPLLIAVQADVEGVDIEDQFLRGRRLHDNELIDEDSVQGDDIGALSRVACKMTKLSSLRQAADGVARLK